MVKLYILSAEPYNQKEVILETSIAEFLVIRDLVFCNYTLPHLRGENEAFYMQSIQGFL